MVPNAIEREILIDAPVDVVWQVITEPDQIIQWFSTEAAVDGHVGGGGYLRFKPSGDSYTLQVEALEPPRRFVFRWVQPEGAIPRSDNSMLVEFTLHAEGGGTRLRLVESGFDQVDWSDDAKAKYFDDHSRGWSTLINRLRAYAASR